MALSTGSACAYGEPSHVLEAINHKMNNSNVVRISIPESCTYEQISMLIKLLPGGKI